MNKSGALYEDDKVSITHIVDYLQCEWLGSLPRNPSYMESKLTEYVTNTFAGAWPVADLKEAKTSQGLRCFVTEWKDDKLISKWASLKCCIKDCNNTIDPFIDFCWDAPNGYACDSCMTTLGDQ